MCVCVWGGGGAGFFVKKYFGFNITEKNILVWFRVTEKNNIFCQQAIKNMCLIVLFVFLLLPSINF